MRTVGSHSLHRQKSEGTHDVSPGLRPDAASTRSKRRGRQGKAMRRLRLPMLGAAIAAASIILASQAPPAQAAYPGADGRILFGRFDYPDVGDYDLFTPIP